MKETEFMKCLTLVRMYKNYEGKPTGLRFVRVGENLYDNKLQKMLSEDDVLKLTMREAKKLRNREFELKEEAETLSGEEQCKLVEEMLDIKDKLYVRDFYKFKNIQL